VAERERFELSVGYKPTQTFQVCTLNHSDTAPGCQCVEASTSARPGKNQFDYYKPLIAGSQRDLLGPPTGSFQGEALDAAVFEAMLAHAKSPSWWKRGISAFQSWLVGLNLRI
jgi:hypothetical protein